jgi:hypothetical protein
MRTTLDIDDEVLAASKKLAWREHKTTWQLSELARRALLQLGAAAEASPPAAIHGFRPFASPRGRGDECAH